jgi:1-acyl-sn-glycerol-3-phosphate acyltransferase
VEPSTARPTPIPEAPAAPAASPVAVLRTLAAALFFIPWVAVLGPPACLFAWLIGSARPLFVLARIGIGTGLALAGVQFRVEGLEHLADPRNTVVVSNHQSHLDAPLLVLALGVDMAAVAKKGVFSIPVVGTVLTLAGFISIDRRDVHQSMRAMAGAADAMRGGRSILVFPEGTRSATGDLLPLKKGGFVAAIAAGSRVVPVIITGTLQCLPPSAVVIRPGPVRVRVLEPVDAGGYSYDQREQLLEDVRERMQQALAG